MRTLTIATRASPLALWQANYVLQALAQHAPNYTVQLLPLTTSGDKASLEKWSEPPGKGLFVKELEEALLDGRADLAVHSMKDLPACFPDGLVLSSICPRANPFDAFVSPNYALVDDLPKHAKIGTASLRRQAQLLAHRPDLQISAVRGNVQTRLNKLQTEGFDALILAAAGLERLGLAHLIRTELHPPLMLPACGQGAIGIECRETDTELRGLLEKLHCPTTALCVNTERFINAQLGGNCHVPVAIYCTLDVSAQLFLQTRVLNATGSQHIQAQARGPKKDAARLAKECVSILLNGGAKALLDEPVS